MDSTTSAAASDRNSMTRRFNRLGIVFGWCLTEKDQEFLAETRGKLRSSASHIESETDRRKIDIALQVAYHAHLGQRRRSGQPFVVHPIEVARLLGRLRLDADAIAAGLLHDTVEDTYLTVKDIEHIFGRAIAELVEGETKVTKLRKRLGIDLVRPDEESVQNLQMLLLAMARDWRVLCIKLADRWHNCRTLQYMKPEKQQKTAQETLAVFVPLADKMGLWSVKRDLEDISFRTLYGEERAALKQMTRSRKNRLMKWQKSSSRQALIHDLALSLGDRGYRAYFVEKSPYEVWIDSSVTANVDDQHDLVSLKVVVLSKRAEANGERDLEVDRHLCYQVLEVIHRHLPSTYPSAFRDFIRYPKDNGYQALHSDVRVPGFLHPLAVHVMTDWMEQVSNFGLLALRRWPEAGFSIPLELPWLQRIAAFANDVVESRPSVSSISLVSSIRKQLTVKRFLLTKEGEVISLQTSAARVLTASDVSSGERSRDIDIVQLTTRPYRQSANSASKAPRPSEYPREAMTPTAPIPSLVPVQIWPWCLIGNDDKPLQSLSSNLASAAVAKMWGVRPPRQQGEGRRREEKSAWKSQWDSGEISWLRETEIRHGRMSLVLLAWWVSPIAAVLTSLLDHGDLQGAGIFTLQQACLSAAAGGPPPIPVLDPLEAVQIMALVGAGEVFGAILPKTRRMTAAQRRQAGPEKARGAVGDVEREDGRVGQSSDRQVLHVVGDTVSLAKFFTLKTLRVRAQQAEVSLGRLSMLLCGLCFACAAI